jgi:tetrahydromethanopterin S-methyltransferase subunit G
MELQDQQFNNQEFNAERSYHSLDKRMSLLEQKLDTIAGNHLAHIQADVTKIERVMYGAVGGIIVNLVAVIFLLIQG